MYTSCVSDLMIIICKSAHMHEKCLISNLQNGKFKHIVSSTHTHTAIILLGTMANY